MLTEWSDEVLPLGFIFLLHFGKLCTEASVSPAQRVRLYIQFIILLPIM